MKYYILLFLLLLTFCLHAQLKIAVVGDTPYSSAGEEKLRQDIINNNCFSEASFLIHIGDIKSGGPCSENHYVKIANILKTSTKPAFIIPGDNEWNDCTNPQQAWSYWEKHLLRFEEGFRHSLPVVRQEKRKENFAFAYQQVLVIGINNVGGQIHDTAEWNLRLADNAEWIEAQFSQYREKVHSAVIFAHASPKNIAGFAARLSQAITSFSKPVLYVQGDSHKWVYKTPWLAANGTLLIIDEGSVPLPVLQIEATGNPELPFTYNREAWPDTAACEDQKAAPPIIEAFEDLNIKGPAQLIITDIAGRILYNKSTEISRSSIEDALYISAPPAGVYLLFIYVRNQVFCRKVIKTD